jgi:hypothetical protein
LPAQTVAHAPQCCGFELWSMHTPLQVKPPPGQAHLPAMQDSLPGHCVPQLPQLLLLVCKSTHAPPPKAPHWLKPASHVQALFVHTPRGEVQFALDRHCTQ